MVSSISLWRRATLVLAAASLLVAVTASPLDIGGVDAVEVADASWGRATGTKSVGSQCASSAECYSGNCVSGLCQRQVTGGACVENASCDSYNCAGPKGNKKCTTPSKLYGQCNATTRCATGLQCNAAGLCKYPPGSNCGLDQECTKDYCSQGVCSSTARPRNKPNEGCNVDRDCISNRCISSSGCGCETPDGRPVLCPGENWYYDSMICARYPIGHACANQGECEDSICKKGKCTLSVDGDACKLSNQCRPGSVCENDKCTTPTAGSQYPAEPCASNEQCVSNTCVEQISDHDRQGVFQGWDYGDGGSRRSLNEPLALSSRAQKRDVPPKFCDYIPLGGKGCRSLLDCSFDACHNGVCQPGSPGDRCTINYQCASKICGTSGLCLAPPAPGTLTFGQPCRQNQDCFSGSCDPGSSEFVYRPSILNSSQLVGEKDHTCTLAYTGGGCKVDADCYDYNLCVQGVCTQPPRTTAVTVTVTTTVAPSARKTAAAYLGHLGDVATLTRVQGREQVGLAYLLSLSSSYARQWHPHLQA